MKKLLLMALFFLAIQTLIAQNLTGIYPNAGAQNETLIVSISGQNTHFAQATNTSVWFKQGSNTLLIPTMVSVYNNEILEAELDIPASQPTGMYHVKVNNSIDGTMSLYFAFEVYPDPNAPVLNAPNPVMGYQASVLPVMISGQNTHFGQGTSTTTIWLQNGNTSIYPTETTILDQENILSQFPVVYNQPTGLYTLFVDHSYDGVLSYSGIEIMANPNPPLIEHVDPPASFTDTVITVTISGLHTNFGQGTSTTTLWMEKDFTLLNPQSVQVTHSDTIKAVFEIPVSQEIGNYAVFTHDDIDGVLQYNSFEVLADTLSLIEISREEIVFYPNPASQYLFIAGLENNAEEVQVRMYDVSGKSLILRKAAIQSGIRIPVSDLNPGMYYIELTTGKKQYKKAIIITR